MSFAKTTITRPPLRYHGGKFRIARHILPFLPESGCYVEPFGGAAGVLLQRKPSRIEVYNDLDSEVVELFRILRDQEQSEVLRHQIELTPFSREEFYRCWTPAEDPIERARRMIVRSFQAIGTKKRREKNGWRTRTPKAVWSPCHAWRGWPEFMHEYVDRLRNVIIEHVPWQQCVGIYDHSDTVFFVDPPYPKGTRSMGWDRDVYNHEMTDEDHEDHEELCRRLVTCSGMVALSTYPNEIYPAILKGWKLVEIKARAQTNAPRVEELWLNPAIVDRHQPELFGGAG